MSDPYIADPDFTLYVGDVVDVLAGIPDESVHCCVTSPPYWGLRDYGTDGQLGLEATPELYVARMVAVFAEVRRVLRKDGTCWLNIGDSYNANGREGYGTRIGAKQGTNRASAIGLDENRPTDPSLKAKDLVGIPWRLAFALQADGWYLRSDIIWSKPNPMPESVTDRPTKAHEYLFLLTKSARYFYDADAIREPAEYGRREWSGDVHAVVGMNGHKGNSSTTGGGVPKPAPQEETLGGLPGEAPRGPDGRRQTQVVAREGSAQHRDGDRWPSGPNRNRRSVWEIATEPYPDAHFATYPQALVEPCIKAGCPEQVCATCGKPRERVTSIAYENPGNRTSNGARKPEEHRASGVRTMAGGKRLEKRVTTEGFTDCGHGNYTPGVVLDPFLGSGTTALVARRHNRRSIGIELNPEYAELAAKRLSQLSLLAGIS